METDNSIGAAAFALTGLIKAFELHADANPERAASLRDYADDARSVRDELLKTLGVAPNSSLDGYGAVSEWTGAIGQLADGGTSWPTQPSRDPWLTVDEARQAPPSP